MLKDNSWHECRIKRRTQDWTYMHVVWRSPSDQPFLMSGFVTRMLNPIGTSICSKYIVSTRMRKSATTQVECSISNMVHLHFWSLQQRVEWKGVLELPQQTSRVGCYQERGGLRESNLMDTGKNLLCSSEIRTNLSQRN